MSRKGNHDGLCDFRYAILWVLHHSRRGPDRRVLALLGRVLMDIRMLIEWLARLCTKTPSFPQSFVQDGILHKKLKATPPVIFELFVVKRQV